MTQTVRSAEREKKKIQKRQDRRRQRGSQPHSVASLLVSGVAILVVILKGTGDVTDPPRPVAMTTSGQGCHIILCVCGGGGGGNKSHGNQIICLVHHIRSHVAQK